MNYLKLRVMFRSFDPLYDYEKAKGHSFWTDFLQKLDEVSKECVVEKKGSLHSIFYFPTGADASEIEQRFRDVLRDLLPEKSGCVLTVSPMGEEDLCRLKENDAIDLTAFPWVNAAKLPEEKPEPVSRADDDPEPPEPDPEEEPKVAAPAESEPARTLSEEAARLSELKQQLLSRVRGQRHAVDEVVQTIFECDNFAAHDKNRSGPLAAFLFAGPSGVGKTFLAKQCAELLGRGEPLIVDMSEYSDNLSNGKFNGDYGHPPVVTGYVRKNPRGVIIFDEIEKAHINTIHLFLQILDEARLRDQKVNQTVSFRDTIIFITTNAGKSLYEDASARNLSGTPRSVVLEALRKDINPATREPFFPEAITTRFANGHVVLFNHLEPFALLQIVQDELERQIRLFTQTTGVQVEYDPRRLSALVLYKAGGISDARTLRGIARSVVVKELQDMVMQSFRHFGKGLDQLKAIRIELDLEDAEKEVQELFVTRQDTQAIVFADSFLAEQGDLFAHEGTHTECFCDLDACKHRVRGVADYILLDPTSGTREMQQPPADIEDVVSDGMDLFEYLLKYEPELPIYILDTRKRGEDAYASLLARGARGVVRFDLEEPAEIRREMADLSMGALVNNSSYALGRAGKILTYNCAQYHLDDETAMISFTRMALRFAPSSSDQRAIAARDKQNGVTFQDIIGCKSAKDALGDACRYLADPRAQMLSGKRLPKGILLYGPPGTGKTMLAKAMANEANAAFIPTTATAFFAPLVGQSEGNVRKIFRRARKYAPSIIFVDEVDAIGRMRTGGISSVHNEDVLNAFIAEMDGFATDERRPVMIIAATNYDISGDSGRVLDPAFVRRFDRKIFVGLPDVDDREAFIQRSLSRHGVHFGDAHDQIVRNMAERSSGMSNADMDIIIETFLRSTADSEANGAALMDALDAFRFGEVNKMSEDQLRQTAFHESGHALVTKLLEGTPAFLTVVSRGTYGGYMEHSADPYSTGYTFAELMNYVCCALAGRAAEREVYGDELGVNTGAGSDLQKARSYIRMALDDYGMGSYLYRKSSQLDGEKLIQEQYERACEILRANRSVLEHLTDELVKQKSLDKTFLEDFFAREPVKPV